MNGEQRLARIANRVSAKRALLLPIGLSSRMADHAEHAVIVVRTSRLMDTSITRTCSGLRLRSLIPRPAAGRQRPMLLLAASIGRPCVTDMPIDGGPRRSAALAGGLDPM